LSLDNQQRVQIAAAVICQPQLLILDEPFLASTLFGMAIAQSVVEEKQNRIVEILASAIPVRQLLIGKVIGHPDVVGVPARGQKVTGGLRQVPSQQSRTLFGGSDGCRVPVHCQRSSSGRASSAQTTVRPL
jgi:ABC-type uncharacterized transport system ATPase subunit